MNLPDVEVIPESKNWSDEKRIEWWANKRQDIRKGLLALKKVLDKHGIFFWLEAGTLLGAIRDGDVISGDGDFDVSFWIKDAARITEARAELKTLGYRLRSPLSRYTLNNFKGYPGEHIGCIYVAAIRKNWLICVGLYRPLRYLCFISKFIHINFFDKIIWTIADKCNFYNDQRARCPISMLGNFRKINFLGEEFNIPERAEDYLSLKYGIDWKTPKVKYKGYLYRLKEVI